MKASFYEYNVAVSGLFTSRANLNVISHNIANAAMPGYSRQYTLQSASRPLAFNDGRGMYGTGSEVYGVSQIRDVYLDRKYWQQKSILGEFTTKNTQLAQIETVFNDLSDTGVRTSFSAFFDRLQDLSTTAQDATYRTNVINAAESLAQLIKSNAELLQKQQRDLNQEVETAVSRVNSLGSQIASLNKQIAQAEYDGSTANDLRDKRALLVDDLSQYVNVTVEELDYSTADIPYDKRYSVSINGYDFVNHTSVHTLMCVPRDTPSSVSTSGGTLIQPSYRHNEMDIPGLYDLYFTDSGASFNIYSTTLKGSLKGLIDMRDGNNGVLTEAKDPRDPLIDLSDPNPDYTTTNFKGIPFYMNKLNQMVRTFARAINEGLDYKCEQIPGATGHMYAYDYYNKNQNQLMFTYDFGSGDAGDFTQIQVKRSDGSTVDTLDYSKIDCLNITVNPNLVKDPYMLACSSDPNKGESYNDVIIGFNKINTYPSLFREGKLLDFVIGTTDHLAIDRMQAENFEISYTEITMSTDNQRLSVSGVDLNEEMMAMIKYNQLYQACAKLVNVIDKIYDTLINRLGVS